MQASRFETVLSAQKYPPFDLMRLLKTCFDPKKGERLCILIDLDRPQEVIDFAFLKKPGFEVQKRAYHIFLEGLRKEGKQLGLEKVDFFAYQTTGGSNLELPKTAMAPDGTILNFEKEIYPEYNILLCISEFSATAPLTATAKRFGFRGATMHGMNETILKTGLAVDYNEVSRFTESLRQALTGADSADIDFEVGNKSHHLHIELGRQEAQKSHGICRQGPDIANLPAGEVYFVPQDASGAFPIKFDDGTLALMQVEKNRVMKVSLIAGDGSLVEQIQAKFDSDPSSAILGELGFGTQVLPHSGRDIQDEKIFGTFHLATGRNDHLKGAVTLDRFKNPKNATHDDILFSPFKTPEIQVKRVSIQRQGKKEILIENYEPSEYLWSHANRRLK